MNLHSRFLTALLEYNANETGSHLDSFLRHVIGINNFDISAVSIRREYFEIDIFVSNTQSKQAVIIENKIAAGDQNNQLQRYHKEISSQGFHDINLVYLTPDGHEPSVQSVGELHFTPISYKSDILPWLTCCQRRAQDLPSLRESIAQYIRVVRKLTGKDIEGAYMSVLTDLCLEGNNLILLHDLHQAMKQAQIGLLRKLWKEIDETTGRMIPDLPTPSWTIVTLTSVDTAPFTSRPNIEDFVDRQSANLVLRFPLTDRTGIGIGADSGGTYFGVYCYKDYTEQRYHLLQRFGLQKALSNNWLWYHYTVNALCQKSPTKEQLTLLLRDSQRTQFVTELVFEFNRLVWERLKRGATE